MPNAGKIERVAELKERIGASEAILLTEYRGLTVSELSELRRSLAEGGASFAVVKNTLMLRAAQESSTQPEVQPVRTTSDAKRNRQDRKEIDRLERQIEKLTAREAELEKLMVEAATDPESLVPLDAEHREVVARREQAEDAWLTLTT